MKQVCEYCDGFISDTDEMCPNCGAPNPQYQRVGNGVPKTIEELKQWYIAHNLPPQEVTRFFIGENYQGARAFGIYQDGERFVVYKNKDDGSRAVRYDGTDEAYAVNELYLKLKERIEQEKLRNAAGRRAGGKGTVKKNKTGGTIAIVVFILIFLLALAVDAEPSRGYYSYSGNEYYHLPNGTWYVYDDYSSSWSQTYSVDEELETNYKDYYESQDYNNSYEYSDFSDTDYYSDWESSSSSSSSDWDSSSSWSSSDSWDSGGGDWGSDW